MDTPRDTLRRHKRIARRISVLVEIDGKYGRGHVKNLSLHGLFIRTQTLPEPGQVVRVMFETLVGRKIEVVGTVRWTTAQLEERARAPGFGLSIERADDGYREFFADLVSP